MQLQFSPIRNHISPLVLNFFPQAVFELSLFIDFLQFDSDVSRCVFLFIYPAWGYMEFFHLWIDCFVSLEKFQPVFLQFFFLPDYPSLFLQELPLYEILFDIIP